MKTNIHIYIKLLLYNIFLQDQIIKSSNHKDYNRIVGVWKIPLKLNKGALSVV